MSNEEKREVARKIVRLTKSIKKIDSILAPYRRRDTPTDNIYRWYQDKGKIGQLLRLKDTLVLRKHKLEVKLGLYSL